MRYDKQVRSDVNSCNKKRVAHTFESSFGTSDQAIRSTCWQNLHSYIAGHIIVDENSFANRDEECSCCQQQHAGLRRK